MSDLLDIHALADGVLGSEEAERVEARIANCPKSMAEYKAILATRRATASLTDSVSCESTWISCRKRLDELDRARRVESFVGRYAWGLCSLFLFLILGAGMMNRSSGSILASGDVANLLSSAGPSVSAPRSNAPEEMSRWVRDVVGPAPVTIQLDRVQILGYTHCPIADRTAVRLALRDRLGFAMLVVIPGVDRIEDFIPNASSDGYCMSTIGNRPCLSWTEGGFAFVVTGDRSAEGLREIADNVRVR